MTETTTTADETLAFDADMLNPQPTANLPEVSTVLQDKQQFSLAVRRMLGLEDASDAEIELFFHVCNKSGLDPFNKEVYMIGRNTEVANWEPVNPDEPDGQKRKVVRWVTKYTIQTAINGFRKRAREIADQKGIHYKQDAPLWCGEDGVWREVWPEKKAPAACKFTVYRDGAPYVFIAHYDEYVQTKGSGSDPNHMWTKMPRNQIRKCAEAGAIQAAFPDELGGLLLEDAVPEPTIIDLDDDGQPVEQPKPQKRRGGRGVGGLKDRAQQETATIVDGEVADPPAADQVKVHPEPDLSDGAPEIKGRQAMTAKRRAAESRMFGLIGKVKPKLADDERYTVYRHITGRPDVNSTDDLTDDEVKAVADQLYEWGANANDEIREIINAADLAAMNNDEGNQR